METLLPQPAPFSPWVSPVAGHPARTVDVWCAYVPGGWTPLDADQGWWGLEELLSDWAQALAARGHRVRVFHNAPRGTGWMHHGVEYLPLGAFRPQEPRDVLISWRCPRLWAMPVNAHQRIHWEPLAPEHHGDISTPQPWMNRVDRYVTSWGAGAMDALSAAFLGGERFHRVAPLAITPPLLLPAEPPVSERAVFAGPPDQGLEQLLALWPSIRQVHPHITLEVVSPRRLWAGFQAKGGSAWLARLEQALVQPGIVQTEDPTVMDVWRAFHQARFWLHPAPLCGREALVVNLLRAAWSGTRLVAPFLGDLETHAANRWDFHNFLAGHPEPRPTMACSPDLPVHGWNDVIAQCWEPLFEGA
ncbi:MAG: hypothetical protein OEV94_01835 [Deltaproteobacteria bacterium]|nr:hypothetical protein [Deltaproteobacteria bacterium]